MQFRSRLNGMKNGRSADVAALRRARESPLRHASTPPFPAYGLRCLRRGAFHRLDPCVCRAHARERVGPGHATRVYAPTRRGEHAGPPPGRHVLVLPSSGRPRSRRSTHAKTPGSAPCSRRQYAAVLHWQAPPQGPAPALNHHRPAFLLPPKVPLLRSHSQPAHQNTAPRCRGRTRSAATATDRLLAAGARRHRLRSNLRRESVTCKLPSIPRPAAGQVRCSPAGNLAAGEVSPPPGTTLL
jgi:hypothetical protein